MNAPRIILLTVLAGTLGLAAAAPVAAGGNFASCSYDAPTHEVTIMMSGDISSLISRDSSGHINFDGAWCEQAATVTNTDKINVVEQFAGTQYLQIELANKGFRPGFTNETGKSDEIEFAIDMGTGLYDHIWIAGTDGVQRIDLGQLGATRKINLNSGERTGLDADVTMTNVEIVTVDAKGGNDIIRGRGKAGTGPDPFGVELRVHGGDGNDKIKAGWYLNHLYGDGGTDTLWGSEGADDWLYLADGAPGDVGYRNLSDHCSYDAGDTCSIIN